MQDQNRNKVPGGAESRGPAAHMPRRGRARIITGALAAAIAALGLAGPMQAAAPAPRLDFSADEMALARGVARNPGLAAWYGGTALAPVFTAPQQAPRRAALLAALGSAATHGLPDVYDAAALAAMEGRTDPGAEAAFARSFARWTHDVGGGIVNPRPLDPGILREVPRVPTETLLARFVAAPDPAAMLDTVPPQSREYRALREALTAAIGPVAGADLPTVPGGPWREGMQDPGVAALRLRLAAMGFDAESDTPDLFDAALAGQLAAYQRRAGLPPDGVAGPRTLARVNGAAQGAPQGLLIALERMRWMGTHDLDARMVWVNLPEFVARVKEGGATVFQTKVVIGSDAPDRRTPEFSDEMEDVVVNPRWNVPRSITTKEYLPRLQKNRNAVAHLDVVDSRGRVIPRESVDFGRYTAGNFPYRLRQKPSDDNALGEVKFIFPNSMNIYLHDTPSKGLFNESRRAFSHGCIRVARPVELAEVLLEGTAADPAARYARARASGRETFLELTPHLPVHLVYFTTTVDENGRIRSLPDVYGRDPLVWAALVKAGLGRDNGRGLETAALAE
ncbi:L,D-transpeptidase family protein [Paracoccus contaminans]|nr:L,D-transpeptidase family protein [Paracoccus contaminans]